MITLKPLFGYLAENRIKSIEFSYKTGLSSAIIKKMREENYFNYKIINAICKVYPLNIKDIMRFED